MSDRDLIAIGFVADDAGRLYASAGSRVKLAPIGNFYPTDGGGGRALEDQPQTPKSTIALHRFTRSPRRRWRAVSAVPIG